MLIRKEFLEQIHSGDVTLAFRRWKRPTVKEGGTLKTAIGLLKIEKLEKISETSLTAVDAQKAGYKKMAPLLKELNQREGDLYKITLAYGGPDPRLALRENDQLTDDEVAEINKKLERLDNRSKVGPWTLTLLRQIKENPMLPAVKLAKNTGYEKEWLKTNVRKLKNLGLTVSHQPGYTLSPRGERVLAWLLVKRN